ncbi:MAG: Rrf2 family transcriptional regulator [Actinomycetota bacterium]
MNQQFPVALHILGFLASRDGEPLTSEIMADTYGTSPVVLRRVLTKLQRAGLVETRRGAGGGSLLARSADNITLLDAYAAVSDDPQLLCRHPDECSNPVAAALGRFVNGVMGDAEQAMLARLDAVSIAEMDAQVRRHVIAAVRQRRR